CPCPSGATCTQTGGDSPPPAAGSPGACCTPKSAASYAGQCGTGLPDGCGNNDISVACSVNQVCVDNATGAPGVAPPPGTPGTCCTRTTCSAVPAGQCMAVP